MYSRNRSYLYVSGSIRTGMWKKNWVQALISIFYYQLLMKSKRTSPHCMWKRKSQFRIIGVSSKRKFWELSWCRWSNKSPFSGIIWFFKCWLYPYDRSDRYSCSAPAHSNINIFWNKLYSSGKSGNHRYQKQSFYRIFS